MRSQGCGLETVHTHGLWVQVLGHREEQALQSLMTGCEGFGPLLWALLWALLWCQRAGVLLEKLRWPGRGPCVWVTLTFLCLSSIFLLFPGHSGLQPTGKAL